MTSEKRTRTVNMEKDMTKLARGSRQIYLPVEPEEYEWVVQDRDRFRTFIDTALEQYPELFPPEAAGGYILHGTLPPAAKMPDLMRRRIKMGGQAYTIMPSYVLPYLVGTTDEVEDGLLLHQCGVPYWLIARICGHDDMFWERLVLRLGRNSVVGTTIKDPGQLPQDVVADEKHTRLNGEAVYVATTVGRECILGASVAHRADTAHLTEAYHVFADETQDMDPKYAPATVNLDGWQATHHAWATLFPTIVIIYCFLHAFLKVYRRGKRSLEPHFATICQRIWDAYHAPTPLQFMSGLVSLEAWARRTLPASPARAALLKLCAHAPDFVLAYLYPTARRTSNMLDRHMDWMDRCFYSAHYFHGHLMTMELAVRGGALLHNFTPYCPRAAIAQHFISPAHRVNGFVYHENWLQNLLVSASRGGFRQTHRIR